MNDIVDLRNFYGSLLGRLAERSIAMALASVWARLPNERLVGRGCAIPWLAPFPAGAERGSPLMPASQVAGYPPPPLPRASPPDLVPDPPCFQSSLRRITPRPPAPDAENPHETLKEMWRVLAPGGRIVIVAPNRRGVWARFEHTPFGTGRPFSRGQLNELLRETNFTPSAWADALHFPPSRRRWVMRLHQLIERAGRRFWPIFSGVVIVEAQKRLYQGVPAAKRVSRRVFVPVLAPQGAATRTGRQYADSARTSATGT